MKATVILSFLLFFTTFINAQEIKSATMVDFGLFEAADPDKLIKQTDTIPMVLGNSFGFHFKIIASPDNVMIPLIMRIRITDTEGEVKDIQYIMSYIPHDFSTGRHSYIFEAQDELIAGVWQFSIEYGGKELLMKNLYIVEKI